MNDRAIIAFRGTLHPQSFAEFAAHRAARLSLSLRVLGLDAAEARFALAGPPDLIDAFEMALSLGPRDCLVRDVWRQENEPERRQDD